MAPPLKKWVYGGRQNWTWFLNEKNGKRTALGQVYIPNKGTVALTADGRAFTYDNGSWKSIHLTDYDKFHISKALKPGGSGVYGGSIGNYGKARQSVIDAWYKNRGTWLATSKSKSSVKPDVGPNPTTQDDSKPEPTGVKTQTRINNTAEGQRIMTWQKKLGVKADGWWGKNTAAAYNKYLANQNTNKLSQQQTTQTIHQQTAQTPIQGTPGYSMHVGNGVTLSTPNGQTTDVTDYKNGQLSATINNGNFKAPNLGTIPTNQLENTPLSSYQKLSENNFNRADIRQGMRDMGLNPYSYSGSDRRQLRTYLNNPTSDNYTESISKIVGDSRVQQRMLNNAVQTDKYQLAKPQLVDLKFKQGGMLVNKYQQGGATSDPMDQLAQVAAKFLQGDTQSGQQLAQVFSDQKVGKQLMQAVQQGMQQKDKRAIIIAQAIQALSGSRKARLGAKLNYFHKDICPAGEKLVYFKKGGEICKACQKMEEGGTADPIADFKKKKAAQKKPIQKQDLATRDSIAANRYNDQEVQVNRPGSYKKNAKGQVQWTPDRTKAPYNKVTKHQQGGFI